MWPWEMRFLGNFNDLRRSSFLMISDKSRIQNYIFSKGSEDSKKMVPECDSFFYHNQLDPLPVLSQLPVGSHRPLGISEALGSLGLVEKPDMTLPPSGAK